MDQLLGQLERARREGLKEVTYFEDGIKVTLKMPEISPRTTDMMY